MISFISDSGDEIQYSGKDFSLTKQCASVYNFQIKGDFTVNIKFDNTAETRESLGLYSVTQTTPFLSKKVFNIIRDGNLLMRGNIVINKFDDLEIECYFISGNANWFSLLQFNCKELRVSRYNVLWRGTEVHAAMSNTSGIIFLYADYVFGNDDYKLYDNLCTEFLGINSQDGTPQEKLQDYVQPVYPCVYLHTLVKEIGNHADLVIGGTLFQNQRFLTTVLTNDGPDIIDPVTGLQMTGNATLSATGGNAISIQMLAPNMKSIDLIKWVAFTFGCLIRFNSNSNTLSLDILDKQNLAEAQDWSEYFISFENDNTFVEQKKTVKVPAPNDLEFDIIDYNNSNTVPFGQLTIESDKDDGRESTIYSSPFRPTHDRVYNTNLFNLAVPYIPFWEVEQEGVYSYTSVTSSGGDALFNGTDFPFANTSVLVRIVDAGSYTSGYYVTGGSGSSTVFQLLDNTGSLAYIANSTGTIYTYNLKKVKPGVRALQCIPAMSVPNFSNQVEFVFGYGGGSIGAKSSLAIGYFSKPYTPYSVLNQYNTGLQYGEINLTGYNDISLSESFLNRVSNMVVNPLIRSVFRLPTIVFNNFDFSNPFIFVKTKNLTMYFYVQKIDNYVDPFSPVRIELLMIN